jgi:hypothetical protein
MLFVLARTYHGTQVSQESLEQRSHTATFKATTCCLYSSSLIDIFFMTNVAMDPAKVARRLYLEDSPTRF